MIGFYCESVCSTLGIVSHSKPSPFTEQDINCCYENAMHWEFISCPWVNWSTLLFFYFKICKHEISSKAYSWLGDRRKWEKKIEQEGWINNLVTIRKSSWYFSVKLEEVMTTQQLWSTTIYSNLFISEGTVMFCVPKISSSIEW